MFFVDRKLPPQTYMNNVRINGGADHIETVGGYTGLGVRGEVMDSGLMTSHAGLPAPSAADSQRQRQQHESRYVGVRYQLRRWDGRRERSRHAAGRPGHLLWLQRLRRSLHAHAGTHLGSLVCGLSDAQLGLVLHVSSTGRSAL